MENSDVKLLSVKQAAEFIGVSVPTIRRWAQQKKLIGLKVGSRGDWRFTQAELLQLVKKTAGSTMQIHPQKLSQIRELLMRDADIIQRLASEHHKEYLGRKGFRNVPLDRYIQNHIAIVKKLADNLTVEDIKRGTALFKILGNKLAKESLRDGLTLEEAVDGTIFLKEAIWQKLKEKDLLSTLSTEDFYQFSFAISTYCDVLVSKIAFAYHENYIHMLKKEAQNKDDFISIATHELKTPVTSLKAFAQMLQNNFTKKGDKKSALYLAKMDVQLNRLTSLIGDLLDAIKINNGKLQYHKEYFDFNKLVLEIIEEMQLTTEKHRINKKLTASKTVFGDRSRIGQVLMNLISNAIKYSPAADKINIATRTDKEQLIFSVQDFGIGITKTDQAKIFDRFQRVGNQNEFGGLGLGLFIAARIIKDHGGTIWVKSEKGNGATVYIRLPIKK